MPDRHLSGWVRHILALSHDQSPWLAHVPPDLRARRRTALGAHLQLLLERFDLGYRHTHHPGAHR